MAVAPCCKLRGLGWLAQEAEQALTLDKLLVIDRQIRVEGAQAALDSKGQSGGTQYAALQLQQIQQLRKAQSEQHSLAAQVASMRVQAKQNPTAFAPGTTPAAQNSQHLSWLLLLVANPGWQVINTRQHFSSDLTHSGATRQDHASDAHLCMRRDSSLTFLADGLPCSSWSSGLRNFCAYSRHSKVAVARSPCALQVCPRTPLLKKQPHSLPSLRCPSGLLAALRGRLQARIETPAPREPTLLAPHPMWS